MSQENVEAVRAIFEPLAGGDFSRWFDEVSDNFVFVTSPDIPDAGTYQGEAARDWVMAWVESFDADVHEALFRMAADGSDVRRLTPWKLDAADEDLSLARSGPTKDRIVFQTYGQGPPRGKSQNVATVPATCAPVSECRAKIRYVTHHSGGEINSFTPSWSPHGRRIAYTRFRAGDRHHPFVGDIWTSRPGGSQRRPVTTSPLFDFNPDWGPVPRG